MTAETLTKDNGRAAVTGGKMMDLINAHDWSATPLGHAERWPVALRTLVDLLLGSSQPMFVAWGPDRTLIYNDAYAEILADKHPAALGGDFLEVWREIRADLSPIVEQALRGEPVQSDDIELWMERKGYLEETHFSFSYTPVRGDAGAIDGFFCGCQEITGQILAERALRASEAAARADAERVQLTLDAGAILGTWIWDMPNDVVSVDDGFAKAFGIDPASTRTGLSFKQVTATVHPEDQAGLNAAIEGAVERGTPFSHQYRVRRADGGWYWVEAHGRVDLGPDGKPLRFPGVLLDLQERREAEAARRESEALVRSVIDGMTEGFMLLGPDFTILDMNAEALRLDPRPREAIIGRNHWEAYPGTKGSELGALYERAMAERVPVSLEHNYRWADGRSGWYDMRAYPVRDGLAVFYRDVTERRQAAEALAAQASEREAILSQLAEGVIVTDREGRITFVNEAAERLHGVKLLGVAPADYSETYYLFTESGEPYPTHELPLVRAVLHGETTVNTRWRIRRPNGTEVLAIGSARPIVDGEMIGAVLTLRDDTERARAEHELRRSETRLRFLSQLDEALRDTPDAARAMAAATELLGRHLGTSRCAYAAVDADNDTFLIHHDYTATGITSSAGKYSLQLFGSRAAADMREGRTLVIRDVPGELPPGEGREMFQAIYIGAIVCCPLVRGGRLAAMMAVHQDQPRDWNPDEIALIETVVERCWAHVERVGAETRLRQLNETLEQRVAQEIASRNQVWDQSLDLLVVVESDTTLDAINPAWQKLLGWRADELLGTSFLHFTHPDDVEETAEEFQKVFERPLVDPYEFRMRHKDGSWRRIAWTASFQQGKVYATGRDVTAQREQEQALAATEQALRQSQKLETIGQLTGGVAHDFNNLLMAIRSSLELLERRLPPGDERLAGLVKNAVKAAERGAGLTQRMLAFARKQELDPKPTDVVRLVNGMRDLIERSIGAAIDISFNADPATPAALVDANQLEMAILNLALNARDAMEDGDGKLTITVDQIEITQSSDLNPGTYVRVRLTDNGCGMDEQTLSQAMEPFFTTKGVGKGTGLGLSMIHGLARQSGGAFQLESKVGQGTAATLLLPVTKKEITPLPEHKPAAAPAHEKTSLKVLAVDDDGLVLFGTIALLEDMGHEVLEAACGADALAVLESEPGIDCIITDQAMPKMTGVELARIVAERWPHIPVILASGYAEMPEGAGKLIAARLEKPFTESLLRAAVTKALEREPAPAD